MWGSVGPQILGLPPLVALLVVFALPGLESSAFVGFVFPGEVALILGGVLASQGRVPLVAVIVAAVAGSMVGDSVGYVVGRRHARRLLESTVGRFINHDHFDRAEAYLAVRGGSAVIFGRFTVAVRVMVPGLAGMSGLQYRTFAVYNVAGAVAWETSMVLFGYLGGNSWRHLEHVAFQVGLAALSVVVLFVLAVYLGRRGIHTASPGAGIRSMRTRASEAEVDGRDRDVAGNAAVGRPRGSARSLREVVAR